MQHLFDLTSPARPRILTWINDTGVECPPFGIICVQDITESQDDGDDLILRGSDFGLSAGFDFQSYAVNLGEPVASGKQGRCTLDFPTYAAYDPDDGFLWSGAIWGPDGSGDFKLHPGFPGFRILGNPVNGVVAVMAEHTPLIKVECKETLKPGDGADGWVMKWNHDELVWERATEEPNVLVTGGPGWKGVCFGFDVTGLEDESTLDGPDVRISLVDAWISTQADRTCYAIGKGWTEFSGTIQADAALGETVNVVPDGHDFEVEAIAKYGAAKAGVKAPIVWSDDQNQWHIQPTLDAVAGCGLIEEEGEFKVDIPTLVGNGLEDVAGESVDDCHKIGVKAACHILVDEDGVRVDSESLAGDGLEVSDGDCPRLQVKAGCHITSDGTGVALDAESLAGTGLEVSSDECKKLQVKTGCGTKLDEENGIAVDAEALAGTGLEVDGDCQLKVSLIGGCGIIANDNIVTADAEAFAGIGLKVSDNPEGCALDIDLTRGCGIGGEGAEVKVQLEDLVAKGLAVSPAIGGGCDTLIVKESCHINVTMEGVSVDLSTLAGDGLEQIEGEEEEDCDSLAVKAGCGITVDEDGVAVDLDALAGDGLKKGAQTPCPKMEINAGCHLNFADGKLVVTPATLIFNPTQPSGLELVIVEEEELCDSIKVSVDDSTIYLDESGKVAVKPAEEPLVIPFVADVTWNPETCTMTKTMGTITSSLPASLFEVTYS